MAICKGKGNPISAEVKNKTFVHEFFEEAWVKGNVAAVDEFMAADYVEHPRPSTLALGTEDLKQLVAAYIAISYGVGELLRGRRRSVA